MNLEDLRPDTTVRGVLPDALDRLYTLCGRKKRGAEAVAYNGLVQSWPEIVRLAREPAAAQGREPELFETEP